MHNLLFRCSTTESQEAAHQLLVTLAEGCADNLKEIVDRLITIHHSFNPEISKEWEVWISGLSCTSINGFVVLVIVYLSL